MYMVTTYDTTGAWSKTYYDSLQRVIRTVNKSDKSKDIITDTVYDTQGRVIGKSLPYFKRDFTDENGIKHEYYSANWIKYSYDILSRVVKQITPIHDKKSKVTTYSYNGLSSTITTSKQDKKTIIKNTLGKIIKVIQNDGTAIEYSYDALNNLTQTKIGSRVTRVKYDNLGRKIELTTPENGTVKYAYNAFGELIKQTDNKGNTTTFKYDKLSRVTQKTTGKKVLNYSYDKNSKGKLSKIDSSENWGKEYKYNKLGQLINKTTTIDDQELAQDYKYDEAGRLVEKMFPSNLRLKYYYNTNGSLDKITIPKKDLWDYNFINLAKKLEEIAKYIYELDAKSNKIKDNIIKYTQKLEYYKETVKELIANIGEANNKVKRLKKAANRMNKYIKNNKRRLKHIRAKIQNAMRKVGNVTFKYVRTVGRYYKYRYSRCASKNWKGHCKKYNNYNAYIPKWLIRGKSRYCVGSWIE